MNAPGSLKRVDFQQYRQHHVIQQVLEIDRGNHRMVAVRTSATEARQEGVCQIRCPDEQRRNLLWLEVIWATDEALKES